MKRLEYLQHFETLPVDEKAKRIAMALTFALGMPTLWRYSAFRRGVPRSTRHINIRRHSFKV